MDKRLRIVFLFLIISYGVNEIVSGKTVHNAMDPGSDTTSHMINGWEYYMRSAHSGHPFFVSNIFQKGIVDSDLGYAEKVLIMYDCFKDVLVIQILREGEPYQIVLNPEFVNGFQLHGKYFINLKKISGTSHKSYRNYYERLSDGNVKLLLAHEKVFLDDNSGAGSSYSSNTYRYFYKDSELHEIKNARSLYRMFPENKKELKKYIKENQLILKIMPESEWINLADYCSKLK